MQIKYYLLLLLFATATVLKAQRPATKAEHDEDARVLKIISQAMPHDIEEAPEPGERCDHGEGLNSSDLTGIGGFYNNMNFVTRNTFKHQYKINYQFTRIPAELAGKLNPLIDEAKGKMDEGSLTLVDKITHCDITVIVNGNFCSNAGFANVQKIASPYGNTAYSDAKGYNTTLFFGDVWKTSIKTEDRDVDNGRVVKAYEVCGNASLAVGTLIQSIVVNIDGHPEMADYIMRKINWAAIKGLLGTGRIMDDISQSDTKKFFIEKPVSPVPGANTVSFIYVDENGNEKQFNASSSKHDLPNCAILRNHNENLQVMEFARTEVRLTDDNDNLKWFRIAIPVLRTTGAATATWQSNHDYEVEWGAMPGLVKNAQVLFPDNMEITITKWAPVGDFIEGTFSGSATSHDPTDPLSNTMIKYTVKSGKFRMRRVADEGPVAGL